MPLTKIFYPDAERVVLVQNETNESIAVSFNWRKKLSEYYFGFSHIKI